MNEYISDETLSTEQAAKARNLFAAVVLAALDDAIADDQKYGNGPEQIARWAQSRDGREVLTCAGIEPNSRVVDGLIDFVEQGVRTSVALSHEESERQNSARDKQTSRSRVDDSGFGSYSIGSNPSNNFD